MTPCIIANFTHRFGAPANWNEAEGGHCAALYVRAEVLDGVPFMRSAWEGAPVEAIKMVAGGKLILGISGPTHPVVNMMVEAPADFEPTFTAVEQRKPDGHRVMRVEMLLAAGHRVFAEGVLTASRAARPSPQLSTISSGWPAKTTGFDRGETTMTDTELIAERKRAEYLADLCQMHGYTDGATAHRATANAIGAEQVKRQRDAG